MVYFIERNVSIRASLQQRGELIAATVKGESSSFNPRLTSAARRTPVFGWVLLGAAMFKSAPHFSSEANSFESWRAVLVECFNPRLTSAARRTLPISISPETWDRFNPRLTSAARRTWLARSKSRAASTRFNPRLTSAARRTSVGRCGQFLGAVSIRASLQQRGERRPHRNRGPLWRRFQSAPHFSSEANAPFGHD